MKRKTPLKIGDRVIARYVTPGLGFNHVWKGKISLVGENGAIQVEDPRGKTRWFSDSGIRRLKHKKPRKEFWVLISNDPYPTTYRSRPQWGGEFDDSKVIHVREVRQ